MTNIALILANYQPTDFEPLPFVISEGAEEANSWLLTMMYFEAAIKAPYVYAATEMPKD
jgi:hypothetical protein